MQTAQAKMPRHVMDCLVSSAGGAINESATAKTIPTPPKINFLFIFIIGYPFSILSFHRQWNRNHLLFFLRLLFQIQGSVSAALLQ